MTDAANVLALIDAAVADFDLGPDAMRWSPGPALQPEPPDPTVAVESFSAALMEQWAATVNAMVAALRQIVEHAGVVRDRMQEHAFVVGVARAYKVRPRQLGIDMHCACHSAPFPAAGDYRRRTKHRNRRRR